MRGDDGVPRTVRNSSDLRAPPAASNDCTPDHAGERVDAQQALAQHVAVRRVAASPTHVAEQRRGVVALGGVLVRRSAVGRGVAAHELGDLGPRAAREELVGEHRARRLARRRSSPAPGSFQPLPPRYTTSRTSKKRSCGRIRPTLGASSGMNTASKSTYGGRPLEARRRQLVGVVAPRAGAACRARSTSACCSGERCVEPDQPLDLGLPVDRAGRVASRRRRRVPPPASTASQKRSLKLEPYSSSRVQDREALAAALLGAEASRARRPGRRA